MGECSPWSSVSSTFSTLSLMSWICAQLPQIFTNYRNKSAEGISASFLLLWFMGDFLSLTSCLLSDVVLKFQIYLSMFFLCNDVALCFQYYYYNSIYPKRHASVYTPLDTGKRDDEAMSGEMPQAGTSIHVRHPATHVRNSSSDNSAFMNEGSSPTGSYNSTSDSLVKKVVGATLVSGANALPVLIRGEQDSGSVKWGVFLGWCATGVYILSRCPQLWKNYKRKSVDGINSVLFGAALCGNISYTLSILTSCEFMLDDDKSGFIVKELPYILGSSGTCVFDLAYFYQRYLYRDYGKNTNQMDMETWGEAAGSESSSLM